jgi:HlyD family secretion protein
VDVARAPEVRQRKRRRRLLTVLALLAGVAVASLALARLEPAVPTVARGSLVLDKVTRGSFTREVPGLGTLVPHGGCRPRRTDASSASSCVPAP